MARQRENGRQLGPLVVAVIIGIFASCLLPLVPRSVLLAQASPDPRFGAVEAFRDPNAARDLNLGWERIIFYWAELQRNGPNDAWNIFHVEDGWLNDAALNGRQVVGLIENTPAWATDGQPGSGVPRGLYLPSDDPDNLWASFIRTLVKRYAGRVDHWIIWNEPDIEPPADGVQFDGSVADYYQLVKVAYLVARQENPRAVIHLAGLTYYHDLIYKRASYLQRYLDEAHQDSSAAARHAYFDVATLHLYFTSDSVYDITRAIADRLRANGLNQPIWIDETNAAPSFDPLNPWSNPTRSVTLDQQAAFIVHAFALGLAAGAERIGVYKLMDFPAYAPGFPAYGLIRADHSQRPAYAALKIVTTYLRDTRAARVSRSGSLDLVTLDRGPQTTRVAWSRGPSTTTLSLPAYAGTAKLISLDGSIHSIAAVNGKYALTLPAAHCDDPNYGCAIGGTPIILVEDAPARMEAASSIDAATATPGPSSTGASSTPSNIDLPIGAIVIGLGIELVLVIVVLRLRTPRHVSGRK